MPYPAVAPKHHLQSYCLLRTPTPLWPTTWTKYSCRRWTCSSGVFAVSNLSSVATFRPNTSRPTRQSRPVYRSSKAVYQIWQAIPAPSTISSSFVSTDVFRATYLPALPNFGQNPNTPISSLRPNSLHALHLAALTTPHPRSNSGPFLPRLLHSPPLPHS